MSIATQPAPADAATCSSDADGTDEVPGPDDRLEGSITTAAWAATMGAAMIRVHDVRATVAALDAVAPAGAAA